MYNYTQKVIHQSTTNRVVIHVALYFFHRCQTRDVVIIEHSFRHAEGSATNTVVLMHNGDVVPVELSNDYTCGLKMFPEQTAFVDIS